MKAPPDFPHVRALGTKTVSFRFRGRSYDFALSQGLFSSADIDSGSRFLLKVFSEIIDEDLKAQKPLPCRILDAGSGVGILGICAAGALEAADSRGALFLPPAEPGERKDLYVRAQDRDELARIFTAYNARQNGLEPEILDAWTEPLLAGPGNWDLILSNIPAKAGLPVLEDFVRRSVALLNSKGRVLLVAVNPLADFFDRQIQGAASLLRRENAPGHTVFVYAPEEGKSRPCFSPLTAGGFFVQCPGYIRNRGDYSIEETSYHLDTVHGAPGFDRPGGAVVAAVKLAVKLKEPILRGFSDTEAGNPGAPVLVWEGDQGHFSAWFAAYFSLPRGFALAGRNILSLTLARRNTAAALGEDPETGNVRTVLAGDLYLDRESIGEAAGFPWGAENPGFPFIAAFPEIIPQTRVIEPFWEALGLLASPSGLVVAGFSSAEAERFDRQKPTGFTRLGDIRREGFRALAYRKTPS